MKRYFSVLIAVLLIMLTCLTAAGSEAFFKEKANDIDDFFADYALVTPPEPIHLPIIMYHQISKKESKLGTYVISVDEFEQDLQMFTDLGFTAITVDDLIKFVTKKDTLPEKPIMLTFDDGAQSDYIYALPLLQKYEMKAIFSIVGKFADKYSEPNLIKNVDYAHLCWDEIREMYKSGLADFQNHSYGLHVIDKRHGPLPCKFESDKDYQQVIQEDLGRLNAAFKEHIGIEPKAFTCPFGCYNDRLREAVRRAGFSVIFTSHQKMNTLTGDPEELFMLKRFLRTHGKDMYKLVSSWAEYYNR